MKSIIQKCLQGVLLVPVLALGVSTVMPVLQPVDTHAQIRKGVDDATPDEEQRNLFDTGGLFQTVVNILLFLIGAVAVVMLIYGGFRYVTSAGDSSAVTSAKNTILYAIIGIVVALLSYAILDFVLTQLGAPSA